MTPSRDIHRLIEIMAALRAPSTGCPWDLKQTFSTIAPYTLEEAYEVVDAIERGDNANLREELGDLLLQVAFHARLAEEQQSFDFGDVVESITSKLIRRHPHIFGEATGLSPEQVKVLWNEIKSAEKREKAQTTPGGLDPRSDGALSGVSLAMPALTRALKLQEKASKVGFDWNDSLAVIAKIREEIIEVEAEIVSNDDKAAAAEVGDLLFTVANLARHLSVDPEQALRGANAKFERRFLHIETALTARNRSPIESSLEEMDALWNEAKARERTND